MRKKYTLFLLISTLFLGGFSSCDDFGDLNEDPTKSTGMDPNLLLPTIQMYLTNDFQEWHRHMMYPGGFVQQWCGDWGTVEYGCLGIKNSSYMGELWNQRYTRLAKNITDIIERTKDDPELVNINALGRIMKVYIYSQLTDMYGDIPYFNAGQGYYAGVLKPKYDPQEKIYSDFFTQLEMASQQLDGTKDKILYDHYYAGNIEKWRKFANSLRLRLALRLIKVDPQTAQKEAEEAISLGVMQDNGDICVIKYENVANPSEGPGRGNGLSNRLSAEPRNFRYSRKLISYMEETTDPRITMYGRCYLSDNRTDVTQQIYNSVGSYTLMARPTSRFDWEENPAPITITVDGSEVAVDGKYQYLQPSAWLTAYNAPYINMSYAEVELLLAEAAHRGWTVNGSAETHFQNALRASVEQMTLYGIPAVSESAIQSFINANTLLPGSALEQINMQLWVGHTFNPFEAFANWRRTNVPEITFLNYDPTRNQSNGMTPRRILYPLEEQIKNEDNYREATDRVPGYDWTIGVWWDKN
ncbi:MAG: SusD/RagB family nutrient-binding outer membrane lipoprotein [Synergistaceae bacterium]|nr:SusD/RagB family nutrient-binding outer membrane lipoprotein [Synergistaceae bacterium]